MSEVNQRALSNVIITGKGKVIVAFDYAVFVATVQARNKNSRAAKEEAKKSIDALQKVLDEFHRTGVTQEVITFFEVQPEFDTKDYRRVHTGYVAEYTLRFTTRCMDKISDIHNTLTEVGGNISVASPMFKLNDETRETVQVRALEKAWRGVQGQLRQQCQMLDENEDDYEICWWNVGDDESSLRLGKGRLQEDDTVDIFAGMAHVYATLSVGYRKVIK